VYFSYKYAKTGGQLRLQKYQSMPHVWQMFPKHVASQASFKQFAKFIGEVTDGKSIQTEMRIVNGKGVLQEGTFDLEKYPVQFTREEVHKTFLGRSNNR
jgi:hypothetical protein